MSDKLSKVLGICLLIVLGLFIYWMQSGNADEWSNEQSKNDILEEIENDIFLPNDFEDKALLFIGLMKNKDKHYNTYDVRISLNEGNDVSDVLTSIKISEGAYNFFNGNVTDDMLANPLNPLKIGPGKDLYECVKTCLERYEAEGGQFCDCSVFYNY